MPHGLRRSGDDRVVSPPEDGEEKCLSHLSTSSRRWMGTRLLRCEYTEPGGEFTDLDDRRKTRIKRGMSQGAFQVLLYMIFCLFFLSH